MSERRHPGRSRTNRIDHVPLGRLSDAHTVRLLAYLNDRTRRETEALMQPDPGAYHGRPIPIGRSRNTPRNGRVLPADCAAYGVLTSHNSTVQEFAQGLGSA